MASSPSWITENIYIRCPKVSPYKYPCLHISGFHYILRPSVAITETISFIISASKAAAKPVPVENRCCTGSLTPCNASFHQLYAGIPSLVCFCNQILTVKPLLFHSHLRYQCTRSLLCFFSVHVFKSPISAYSISCLSAHYIFSKKFYYFVIVYLPLKNPCPLPWHHNKFSLIACLLSSLLLYSKRLAWGYHFILGISMK